MYARAVSGTSVERDARGDQDNPSPDQVHPRARGELARNYAFSDPL